MLAGSCYGSSRSRQRSIQYQSNPRSTVHFAGGRAIAAHALRSYLPGNPEVLNSGAPIKTGKELGGGAERAKRKDWEEREPAKHDSHSIWPTGTNPRCI
jgi:hypothetical protein